MAYLSTPVVTWNRSTPRDGLLLNQEFAQIYSDIEDHISGNGGSAPPKTMKAMSDLLDNTAYLTGDQTIAGTKTFSGAVILPQTTTPAQTAEGSIVWDTDSDLLTVGDGSSRKVMVDTSQNQTIAGVKTFSSTIVGSIDGIKETGSGAGVMRWKIIEIGDWNMDSDSFLTKPHGLTLSKIRHTNVVIRMDVTGVLVDLQYKAEGYFKTDDTNVNMHRVGGGEFDSTYYDATSYNRGYITIGYID